MHAYQRHFACARLVRFDPHCEPWNRSWNNRARVVRLPGRDFPDLLVASTHARGGIARLLVGSVAESEARNLRTPVLLVPIDGAPLFRVAVERAHGTVDDAVVAAAERTRADLIAMLTAGHDGAGDVLLASHTERVLHRCRRPLLWVPLSR